MRRFRNIKDNVTGQYRKLRVEERICNLCDMNETENELHFISVCPKYTIERNELYGEIAKRNVQFMNMDHNEKYVYLLKTESNLLAKYVEKWGQV